MLMTNTNATNKLTDVNIKSIIIFYIEYKLQQAVNHTIIT